MQLCRGPSKSNGFVYLQKTCLAEDTIEAKRAFEKYAASRGVTIQAYHADDGIFKAKKWMEECHQQKQNLTFAAVNTHHQNGIAKQRISELQEMTRAMLIHTSKRWPRVVTIHLWPYTMRTANQAYNSTLRSSHTDKQSPNKIFDNSAVDLNPRHWKLFGCPVYVLKAELQGTTRIHPKWDAWSQADIYLGQSPINNRNVGLVLNIHTGYVSPQFHVKFDESFHTVQQDKWNTTWLSSTGLMAPPNKVSLNEANIPSRKRRKTLEQKVFANMEISNHPGKRQMVAVIADGPTRHTMSLAPEQQAPANPVSTIPPTMVADELPDASERKPQPTVIRITTRSGCLVKPVPKLISLMMLELVSSTKRQLNVEGELLSFAAMNHEHKEMHNPILAYKAVNPDILRRHEAMQANDQKEFKSSMEKEVNNLN